MKFELTMAWAGMLDEKTLNSVINKESTNMEIYNVSMRDFLMGAFQLSEGLTTKWISYNDVINLKKIKKKDGEEAYSELNKQGFIDAQDMDRNFHITERGLSWCFEESQK